MTIHATTICLRTHARLNSPEWLKQHACDCDNCTEYRALIAGQGTIRNDKPADVRSLEFALAQLRHGYQQLLESAVRDQPEFARGLLGPVIERLERLGERGHDQ